MVSPMFQSPSNRILNRDPLDDERMVGDGVSLGSFSNSEVHYTFQPSKQIVSLEYQPEEKFAMNSAHPPSYLSSICSRPDICNVR